MNNKLYGAILGDLAGQPYEFKYKGDFSEFNIHNPNSHITDDTLMTLATAKALMEDNDFERCYKEIGLKYGGEFFGKMFHEWLQTPKGTIGKSYGNGCLMRISPIIYFSNESDREKLVIDSCLNSHCHSISIISCLKLLELYKYSRGQRLIWRSQAVIKPFKEFQVEADKTIDFIKSAYRLADDDIPRSTVDRIERVVKCGGDSDTNASIIGELMNYTYDDLTQEDVDYVESKLDNYLLSILRNFNKKYD